DERAFFSVSPSYITASLNEDQQHTATLGIHNSDVNAHAFRLSVDGLKDIIELSETSVVIEPGGEAIIGVIISTPPKTSKVLTGKIIIQSDGIQKSVPVIVSIKSRDALFDISIDAEDSVITAGSVFGASINLQNIGLRGVPTDVAAEVFLADANKKIIASLWKETLAVSTFTTLHKDLFIPSTVKEGTYLLIAQATYNNIPIESFEVLAIQPAQKQKSSWFRVLVFDILYAVAVIGGATIFISLYSKIKKIRLSRINDKLKRTATFIKKSNIQKRKSAVRDGDYWDEMQRSIKRQR
ncbi:MAG TPA: hypothetical protein VJB66_04660, partial [Candidatus Nanoarchaeia archaeon]|nr:hypothetical protein [Candidatus Nanoarchaeia archaeon]